jgi:hypothetical protein
MARDYFLKAIELDPSYALAYQGLASCYAFGAANGLLPPDQNWPKAEELINKALALDENLAEAYHGLAAITLYYYRDWPPPNVPFVVPRNWIQTRPTSRTTTGYVWLCSDETRRPWQKCSAPRNSIPFPRAPTFTGAGSSSSNETMTAR